MVSKTNLEAKLAELRVQLKEVNDYAAGVGEQYDTLKAEHDRVLRDNAAHRERERAHIRRVDAERRQARQDAEREDKRKRRQELSDGMLRIRDAFEWSIEHKSGEIPVLNLSVALDGDTYPIVQGVVDKLNAPPRTLDVPGSVFVTDPQGRMQDSINKMMAGMRRAQDYYSFG
jgi:hypothetical protein